MIDYNFIPETLEWCRKHIDAFTFTEIFCDNDLDEGMVESYKLLNWLELTNRNYPIHIHSANPIAAQRMRALLSGMGGRRLDK